MEYDTIALSLTWHVFDGVEETLFLGGILDVRVDEQTVHFRVNVFDGDLEAVEAASFGHLHLLHEALDQVLVDDAVAGGEEGQHVRQEVALVLLERLPVGQIATQVHLLDGPEGSLGFLVHLPNVGVLDGQNDETTRILPQQRLVGKVRFRRLDHGRLFLLRYRLLGLLRRGQGLLISEQFRPVMKAENASHDLSSTIRC